MTHDSYDLVIGGAGRLESRVVNYLLADGRSVNAEFLLTDGQRRILADYQFTIGN